MSTEEIKNETDKKDAAKNDATPEKNDGKDGSSQSGGGFPKGAFIAIAVLALLVIGLVAFIIGDKTGKKKDSGKDNKKASVSTEEVTTDKSTESGTEDTTRKTDKDSNVTTEADKGKKTDADDNSADNPLLSSKSPVYVKLENGNYWGQDSSFTCQYNVNIVNKSGEAVEDWEIVFTGFGKDSKLGDNWSGTYKLADGTLSVKPVDYNKKIDNGSEVNFGFQIVLTSEVEAKKPTKDFKLFINGKEYIPDTGNTESGDKKDDDKTESTQKEDKTEASKTEDGKTEAGKTEDKTEAVDKGSTEASGTPFEVHGKLSLNGVDIVDKNGNKFQLKGVSTHGIAWFPDYVNKEAFKSIRDDWGANLIRLAMYTDESGGYCTDGDKEKLKTLVKSGVDAATELGMYVIIDWHILHDLSPLKYKDEAVKFFAEMSELYKDNDNVIFEICNEPNGGTGWADIKKYAEEVIPVIRKNCPDAIIIVGTPNWSQDADTASKDKITGYDNIMYAVHFYAATHKDDIRNKVKTARANGAAVFISEFSICDASGNGGIDYSSADEWMKLLNENNISYAAWNLSNKDETSSLISAGCDKKSGWSESEMSESGKWLREQLGN